ncbi:hypothetical protein QAD02_020861 [Eretmocerus hayati]|uniref:Uncharacterized protein n=1 Tax=Eretmocerus hayati TaxID=131215 RepID=A0ACC2PPL7_9HYME|nr:hypothetical protein QAD02_020861 [Eretmocerus hayati]
MSDSGKTDANLSPSETVRNELSDGDNPTPGIGRGRGTRRGRGRGAALQPEARPRTRSSSKNKKNQDEPEAQLASPNSSKAGSGRVVIPANDVFNSSSENLSAPSRFDSPDPPPTAQEYCFGDVPPQQGLLDGPRLLVPPGNERNQGVSRSDPEIRKAQLASPNSSKAGSGRVVIPANDVFNSSSENLSAPSRFDSPDPPPTAQEYCFGDVPPQQGLLDGPRLLVPPGNERNQGVSRSDPEIRNGNANPRVPTDTPAILLGMKNRQQAFQSRIEEQAMRLSRIEKLTAQIEKIRLNQGNVLNSHANRLDVVENDVRYVSAQAAEVKSQTRELSQSVAHHSECIDNLTGGKLKPVALKPAPREVIMSDESNKSDVSATGIPRARKPRKRLNKKVNRGNKSSSLKRSTDVSDSGTDSNFVSEDPKPATLLENSHVDRIVSTRAGRGLKSEETGITVRSTENLATQPASKEQVVVDKGIGTQSCCVPSDGTTDGSVFWKRDQVGSRRWQEGAEASSPGEERSPEVEEASLGPHGQIRGEVGAGRAAAASAAREASVKHCREGEALGQEGASSPRENAETRRCEETTSDLLQNGVYPQKEGNSMFSAATTECDVEEGIAGAEQLIEEIIKAILPHLNKLLLARRQFENKRRIVDFKRRVLLGVEHEGVSLPCGPLSHKFRTAYRLVHARNPPPDDMLLAKDGIIGNGSDNEEDASDVASYVAEPRHSDEEDAAEIDWCAVEPESVEERYIEAESYSTEPEQSSVEERSGPCYPESFYTQSSSSELDSDVSYEFTYEEEEDINRPVRVLTPTAETYSPTAELFCESSHRKNQMSLEYLYDEAIW